MNQLLQKLFAKRGIEDVSELTKEEKKQFDAWDKILAEKPITIETLQTFLVAKIGAIEGKWADLGLETSKKAELLPYFVAYKALLGVMSTPATQKAELERYLSTLL